MRKPGVLQLRILKEAFTALFTGPYTNRYPFEPHTPYPSFRGKAEFHEADCVGCGACAEVCPARAIEIVDEGDRRRLTYRYDICIFCGECERNCITGKGIKLGQEFELALFDRSQAQQTIHKDLMSCEMCGCVIAPFDQIRWIADRLGTFTFTNPTLMLARVRELGLDEELGERPSEAPATRADHIRVLCPRCRRESLIATER